MWRAFLRAIRTGEYRVNPLTWGALVATVVYTVWPLDLIPDVLPVVGFVDDLGFWAVMVMIATAERKRWAGRLADSAIEVTPGRP